MTDNTADREPEEMSAADIVRQAMQETAAEITRMNPARDFIIEGLAFLEEISGKKFKMNKPVFDDNGDMTAMTSLQVTKKAKLAYISEGLHVTVSAQDDISTNAPAAGDPLTDALEKLEPSDEEKERAAKEADATAAAYGNLTQDIWQQVYEDTLEESMRKRQWHENKNRIAVTRNAGAVLADIARRALTEGLVPPVLANTAAATPAQQAILNGFRLGLRQNAAEIKAVEGAPRPFLTGLQFLQSLSDGKLEVTHEISADRDFIEIQVRALTPQGEEEEPFKAQFIKISAGGMIQLGESKGNYKEHEYDALEEQDIKLLKGIAKAAVFAGKVSSASGAKADPAEMEKSAALAAVCQAEGERGMAWRAANYVIEGLKALKDALGDGFDYAAAQHHGRGDIVLTLKPWQAAPSVIHVNGNGFIKLNKEAYFAFDSERLKAALKVITRNAVLQTQGGNKAQGPRPL